MWSEVYFYLNISPTTSNCVCRQKCENLRCSRFSHINERGPIFTARDGILSASLRIGPTPNVIAISSGTQSCERYEGKKIYIAAFVFACFSTFAWDISHGWDNCRTLVFFLAFLVLSLLQSHDEGHVSIGVWGRGGREGGEGEWREGRKERGEGRKERGEGGEGGKKGERRERWQGEDEGKREGEKGGRGEGER